MQDKEDADNAKEEMMIILMKGNVESNTKINRKIMQQREEWNTELYKRKPSDDGKLLQDDEAINDKRTKVTSVKFNPPVPVLPYFY